MKNSIRLVRNMHTGGVCKRFLYTKNTECIGTVLNIPKFKRQIYKNDGGEKMANVKPAALRTGHTSNDEINARQEAEEKLKGSKNIAATPPNDLTKNGKRLYKEIISLLPNGFLSGGDTYTVRIVAESLDCMQTSSKMIHKFGLFTDDGKESEASKAYERYSKIYDKFSAKIGLSPKDRAALASLITAEKGNQDDELLKALKSDDG